MRRSNRLLAVAPVTAALVAAAVGLGPTALAQNNAGFDEASALLANERNTIDVIAAMGDSVVAVNIALRSTPSRPFAEFVDTDEAIPSGSGSGFLIEYQDDPYLVTNFHVVEAALEPSTADLVEGARVSVTFPGRDNAVSVDIVGVNPSFDLALLQATRRVRSARHGAVRHRRFGRPLVSARRPSPSATPSAWLRRSPAASSVRSSASCPASARCPCP